MAINFEKVSAYLLTLANGTDKFLLGDKQVDQIMNIIRPSSLIGHLGSGLDVTIEQASITLMKHKAVAVAKGDSDSVNPDANASLVPVTVTLDEAITAPNETVSMQDSVRMNADAVSPILVKKTDQLMKYRERKSWEAVVTLAKVAKTIDGAKLDNPTIDVSTITSYQDKGVALVNAIIGHAGKYLTYKDDEQGIDTLDFGDVTIDAGTEIFALIAAVRGVATSYTKDELGRELVQYAELGGFKIYLNKFLATDEIVWGTRFSFVSPFRMVKLYAGVKFASSTKYVANGNALVNSAGGKEIFTGMLSHATVKFA